MKNFFEIVRGIYHNKQKRAIFSLVVWFLFFVIVFALIGKPPKEVPITYYEKESVGNIALKNYKNMKSFEVNYKVEINQNNKIDTYTITGTYFNDKYYLTNQEINLYSKEGNVYVVDDNLKEITPYTNTLNDFYRVDLQILLKDNLYTIITSSEEESKTNYKDGTKTTNYKYSTSDGKTILISVNEYNNIINSIELDFTNYYSYEYKVSITYKNIDNITEFEKSYDDYTIKGVGE